MSTIRCPTDCFEPCSTLWKYRGRRMSFDNRGNPPKKMFFRHNRPRQCGSAIQDLQRRKLPPLHAAGWRTGRTWSRLTTGCRAEGACWLCAYKNVKTRDMHDRRTRNRQGTDTETRKTRKHTQNAQGEKERETEHDSKQSKVDDGTWCPVI